jgi:hypothetical protein
MQVHASVGQILSQFQVVRSQDLMGFTGSLLQSRQILEDLKAQVSSMFVVCFLCMKPEQ